MTVETGNEGSVEGEYCDFGETVEILGDGRWEMEWEEIEEWDKRDGEFREDECTNCLYGFLLEMEMDEV